MSADKSSPQNATKPLSDPMLWLDLVFQMDDLNKAMAQFDALTEGEPRSHVGRNTPFQKDDPGGGDG
jgi:hypothetical protein